MGEETRRSIQLRQQRLSVTPAFATGLVLAMIALLTLVRAAPAQPNGGWIGKRVVQKYASFKLKNGNQVIDTKGITTYRVEKASGALLWLKAEGQDPSGWAPADQVVRIDEAMAFFTDAIRANPGDAHGYAMRATIWREVKHDFDNALRDYDEALRLDQTNAYFFRYRGNTWFEKGDNDKAIADFTDAIRLAPRVAAPLRDRAAAWFEKKDYDKAIADCNDAIRIDAATCRRLQHPRLGLALQEVLRQGDCRFQRRHPPQSGIRPRLHIPRKSWLAKNNYDKAIADYQRGDPARATRCRGLYRSRKCLELKEEVRRRDCRF